MMFPFLVSLLGFVIGFRIASLFIDQSFISKNEMTKIGTIHLLVVITLFANVPHARFPLWCAVFTPIVITSFTLITLVNHRSAQFKERFIETLTLIILKMKSGKAFQLSMIETVNESDPRDRMKLGEIASVVAFSQQKVEVTSDPFIREVILELVKVDRTPHSAIQRLSVFRDRLDLESDFRHKSGQALAQVRAQSLVMSGLYIAVFILVVTRFGWKKKRKPTLRIKLPFFERISLALVRWKKVKMESLAPSLKCLVEIHASLQNGETARSGVSKYIQSAPADEIFPSQLRAILFAWDQGHEWRPYLTTLGSPQRRALVELLFAAISGQSILSQLADLRTEIVRACDREIKAHVDLLPLKMLMPLLLFQFPAFLLLLFGPVLRSFIEEMSR